MKINNRYITFSIATIILIFVYGFVEYKIFKSDLKEDMKTNFLRNQQNFQAILEIEKRVIHTVAIDLANSKLTEKAYSDNNPDLLHSSYLDLRNKLSNSHLIHEMHFFKVINESFASFANISKKFAPKIDISQIRKDINWVIKNKKESRHFQVCLTYSGVRSLLPIFNKSDDLVGVVSIGAKIDTIPSLFKRITNSEAMFINETSVTESLMLPFLKTHKDNSISVGDYIITSQTINFQRDFIKKINLNESFSILEFEDETFQTNTFYIKNFKGEKNFRMVSIKNISDVYHKFYIKKIKESFLIIIFFTLLYYIILRRANIQTKKIEKLSLISYKLKNKDFSVLNNYEFEKDSSDEIEVLSQNIVEMGYSLEEFYKNLQNTILKKTAEIQQNLFIDGLTKIHNRKALEEFVKQNNFEALIFFDIDDFSNINDFFGIEAGNNLLIKVSNKLKDFGEKHNLNVYRVGSDEFAIICKEKARGLELLELTLKEFSNISLNNIIEDIDMNVDFTFGISNGEKASIEKSDIALHGAKQKKLQYLICDDSQSRKEVYQKNILISKKIKDAFKYDNFVLFYQPIYNRKQEIIKYESLIRLKDKDKYLTPYHFLDYARKTKDYTKISKLVIKKSFEKFTTLNIPFSINLSAEDMINPEIIKYFEEMVKKFPNPENITIELLESEEIEELDKVLLFISKVRKYGVRIAIDDFGSGYSNFSYLLDIKPDYLKIDGSIVKKIASNIDSYQIAKTIVEFAHVSNFEVIGEFIDSQEVLDKALELGIDMFQGYHLSIPLKDI